MSDFDRFEPDSFFVRRFPRDSVDFEVNLDSLHEMEEVVPMTLSERAHLRKWVHSGHDIDSNPWGYLDGDDYLMNYLQAYRLEFGFSSGPWDYWKGPESQGFWDKDSKCFTHYPDVKQQF